MLMEIVFMVNIQMVKMIGEKIKDDHLHPLFSEPAHYNR